MYKKDKKKISRIKNKRPIFKWIIISRDEMDKFEKLELKKKKNFEKCEKNWFD